MGATVDSIVFDALDRGTHTIYVSGLDAAGIQGTSLLTLSAANGNTFAGPMILDNGTLSIPAGADLGAGTLTLINGTLQTSAASAQINNPVRLGGTVSFAGAALIFK